MRRYFTLVSLLFLALPAGISISGCVRNPAGHYCNGQGFGLKDTDVYAIDLEPRTTGISLAFGQTRQMGTPTAKTCKGDSAIVTGGFRYATTNNKLVDISPSGNVCAGTWNRNSGGGIADFTICNFPAPLPSTGGLPYAAAFISASADSVTSNPVEVYVHSQVSSISLAIAGQQQCYSQGAVAQLDSEACYVGANNTQYEMCAPSTVTSYACPGGLAPGVTSVPSCTDAIGKLSYTVGDTSVASINNVTNQITAELPGTTAVNSSVAQSGSSAGFFSTCPPQSIAVTLNGSTSGTVTQGVQQNMTTTVTDTNGNVITGLTLDYQSTNPMNLTANRSGGITAEFAGAASVYAICQPDTCNPAPINKVGLYGTGLPVSSNPVNLTVPGTASAYMWFSAPGKSQYFVPVQLLTGTVGANVRLPYVPNSMVMDQSGNSLYFGSSHELMIYGTTNNSLIKEDPSVPGVVLAVSPDNQLVLINDPVRRVFYLYKSTGIITSVQSGVGNAAAWTPDSKTLYITDSASLGAGHSDTLYVYNTNTGWSSYDLSSSGGATNLALMIPGVGAYLSGNPTVAHTWCPTGTVGDYATMQFYPQGDLVNAATEVLAATTDGQHILGAAASGGGIELSDIGVTIPNGACPAAVANVLQPLMITHTLNQLAVSVNATAVNQVVASPASDLAFITYDGATAGAQLPYYVPGTGGAAGTVSYLPLTGGAAITAPVAGAFSPDDRVFFVSTSGDAKIHMIDVQSLTDTQQLSPNLPACAPGSDPDCTITTPTSQPVPATAIAVKPRSTT
ncbi:MAG TPA: hypothetical protein VFI20_01260 [Terracidiphilus sp.]|nr:hypothetical protein [Terracidiphilus sp.]